MASYRFTPQGDAVVQAESGRQHYSGRPQGKLRSPPQIVHEETGAPKAVSIPSQFATLVLDNSEKRGFGAQARRFNYDFSSATPGPAAYSDRSTEAFATLVSPSYSQRGTGGFASKTPRKFGFMQPAAPGPAAYDLRQQVSKKSFGVGNSRNFRAPIAVAVDKATDTPAPNAYLPNKDVVYKQNNVTAVAAFRSQSKREPIDTKHAHDVPAPGSYDVKDDLLHDAVRVPVSSFKTTANRTFDRIKSDNPAPGTYHPYEPSEPANRTVLPRHHYLSLSVPAVQQPRPVSGPGPAQYNLSQQWAGTPHYMSSSMFVSNSSRWASLVNNPEFPGPAHYRPEATNRKQSHIFNSDRKWVPV